jgi:SecA DEAD-like domain
LGGYAAYLGAVKAFEADMRARTDGELRALTEVFRRRLGDGESLDDLLAEGFAMVREGARRTLFQRHHDSQVIAGVAVHSGSIAAAQFQACSASSACIRHGVACPAASASCQHDLRSPDSASSAPIYANAASRDRRTRQDRPSPRPQTRTQITPCGPAEYPGADGG